MSPRSRCLMSKWLSISIYLVLFFCCVKSLDSHSERDAVSPHVSVESAGKGVDSLTRKNDALDSPKSSTEHAVAARKGVKFCDESAKNESSSNCSSKIPASENNMAGTKSASISYNSNSNSTKNTTTVSKELVKQIAAVTTAKPVMKPLYTFDNFSDADYDESSSFYSSSSSWSLTTFSLSLFIVFLVILIIVLFYRLKYKFSVEQNYRRVDYLIDGMYID